MITVLVMLGLFSLGIILIALAVGVAVLIFTAAGWIAGVVVSILEAVLAAKLVLYMIKIVSEAF